MIEASFSVPPGEVLANLRAAGPRITESLRSRMLRVVITLQRTVVAEKLQGQVLHHRSGNLQRSITYDVSEEDGAIQGTVGAGRQAPYAKIHEYGGVVTIREHLAHSVNGRAFTVQAHSATFPERSFLRSTLHEKEPWIRAQLAEAVTEAIAA